MFVSNLGYGILFDITSNGTLNWEERNTAYSYTGNCADSMDYFFFYGPEADSVIANYQNITGQVTIAAVTGDVVVNAVGVKQITESAIPTMATRRSMWTTSAWSRRSIRRN